MKTLMKVCQFGRRFGFIADTSTVDLSSIHLGFVVRCDSLTMHLSGCSLCHRLDDYTFSTDSARALYGPSPSWRLVADLLRWRRECDEQTESGPSWNCRVHTVLFLLSTTTRIRTRWTCHCWGPLRCTRNPRPSSLSTHSADPEGNDHLPVRGSRRLSLGVHPLAHGE